MSKTFSMSIELNDLNPQKQEEFYAMLEQVVQYNESLDYYEEINFDEFYIEVDLNSDGDLEFN